MPLILLDVARIMLTLHTVAVVNSYFYIIRIKGVKNESTKVYYPKTKNDEVKKKVAPHEGASFASSIYNKLSMKDVQQNIIKPLERKMKNHILNFITITVFIFFSNQAQATLASSGSLYLKANSSDFLGGIEKREVTLTHGIEGIFSIESNFEQGASVTFENSNFWSFEFAAPTYDPITNTNNGNPLEVSFYNHATDFPFNSPTRPGLNFFGNGWDNFYNDPDAWFDVVAIEYGFDNEVLSLAIDFLQFDKNIDPLEASTFGSLRINSNVALNFSGESLSQVPVPTAIWLFGSGLMTLIGLQKRKQ